MQEQSSTAIVVKTPAEENRERALARLSPDERSVYDRFVRAGRHEISADFAARLYGLYLQGVSCDDIARLNSAVDLATILAARVRYLWDERKDAYVADLMCVTGDVVRKTAAETVQLLGLMMAVATKRHGDAFKKYLATGDESVLGEFDIKTIKQMKDAVEMLMKVTGADRKQEVKLTGGVLHEDGPQRTANARASRITAEEADEIRRLLEQKRKAK